MTEQSPSSAASEPLAPHPFTIANYRYFWAARLSSMLSQNAMMLIIGWQAYNLAREDLGIGASAGILGLLGLLQFVPLFLLTPITGWVADRHDRRWIARAVLAGQALLCAWLAWMTFTDAISLYAIYVAAVILALMSNAAAGAAPAGSARHRRAMQAGRNGKCATSRKAQSA